LIFLIYGRSILINSIITVPVKTYHVHASGDILQIKIIEIIDIINPKRTE
tara:strand:- start:411 stop:560 length:150 start_codon:yes stop_codon:yes gene_type:complete